MPVTNILYRLQQPRTVVTFHLPRPGRPGAETVRYPRPGGPGRRALPPGGTAAPGLTASKLFFNFDHGRKET
eukprot:106549-Hanusia_phi.AAC.1